MAINPIILALPVITVALISSIGVLAVLRHRASAAPQDIRQTPEGLFAVPVTSMLSRGGSLLGGMSRNSMRPSLAIGADGLHFKVLTTGFWAYREIDMVDARKGLFGASVIFGNGRSTLVAGVRDMEMARDVLARLPRSLPVTAEAATLRDGTDAAATTGLRRYSGPLR